MPMPALSGRVLRWPRPPHQSTETNNISELSLEHLLSVVSWAACLPLALQEVAQLLLGDNILEPKTHARAFRMRHGMRVANQVVRRRCFSSELLVRLDVRVAGLSALA